MGGFHAVQWRRLPGGKRLPRVLHDNNKKEKGKEERRMCIWNLVFSFVPKLSDGYKLNRFCFYESKT